MESTGSKGRIQVSEQTVEELRMSGFAHWAVPRENRIEAKGKGSMQTYWIDGGNYGKSASSGITSSSSLSVGEEHDDD